MTQGFFVPRLVTLFSELLFAMLVTVVCRGRKYRRVILPRLYSAMIVVIFTFTGLSGDVQLLSANLDLERSVFAQRALRWTVIFDVLFCWRNC